MEELKVIKRDGSLEEFQRTKIASSVTKAGANPTDGEDIALKVEEWARQSAQEGKVKTRDIRTKVLELLRPLNSEAAEAYERYKKPV